MDHLKKKVPVFKNRPAAKARAIARAKARKDGAPNIPPPALPLPGRYLAVVMPAEEQFNPTFGRPSAKTPELIEAIYNRLCMAQFLIEICCEDWAPAYQTANRWILEDAAIRTLWSRAKQHAADWCMLEAQRLLEQRPTLLDAVMYRERLAHLRWRAERLAPDKYGSRVMVDVSGSVDVNHKLVDSAPAWLKDALPAPEAVAGLLIEAKAEDVSPAPSAGRKVDLFKM